MKSLANTYFERLVETRRYLHQHPELSFKATKTHTYILNKLKKYNGVTIQAPIGETLSILATIGEGHPHIAFRADFDALPIQDEKDVTYRSLNEGVSHACGHDAHTSTLLAFFDAVYHHKDNLTGAVSFIFQDTEEVLPGSAQAIIESGALDNIDKVYGQHYWSQIDLNTVEVCSGELIASADRFEINVIGSGGHAAYPQTVIDPIVIASELIISLQTIVSRQLSPLDKAVVSFGMVDGGHAFNVIPGAVRLTGTVRSFDREKGNQIRSIIETESKMIAEKRGARVEIDYVQGFPPVINHEKEAAVVAAAIEQSDLNYVEATPLMIGEDFSYYVNEKPGAFFLTGSRSDLKTSVAHHASTFDIDERAMVNGLSVFMQIAEQEGVITWT